MCNLFFGPVFLGLGKVWLMYVKLFWSFYLEMFLKSEGFRIR